jgi:hypothetical protein
MIGYQGISLTNLNTSAASSIAAGSKIEVAGSWFSYASDDLPNASSWTAITTATTAYLQLVPSGTAGSQILSASWTATEPVWSTSKQGWYASAGSASRVVVSAYKSGTSSQEYKHIFNGLDGPKSMYKFTCTSFYGGGGSTNFGSMTLDSGRYEIEVFGHIVSLGFATIQSSIGGVSTQISATSSSSTVMDSAFNSAAYAVGSIYSSAIVQALYNWYYYNKYFINLSTATTIYSTMYAQHVLSGSTDNSQTLFVHKVG